MESVSLKLESFQTTPASIGDISSEFCDIESVVSLGDNALPSGDVNDRKVPTVNPEFAFQDGSIEIRTIDQAFWVHEYHMNKFSVLAAIIQKAKGSIRDSGCRTVLVCEPKILGTDIYNALKVIYASHLDGIPDFDSNIIISALRIASTLEFPGLRNFAISKLEGMVLSAIQRIQLSDEFSLPSLEMPAFIELCNRAEPITLVEADILGTSRFVEIARIRETQRLHQAAKLVENILPKLLESTQLRSSTGTEYARDGPDYCSGRSQLPSCNCRYINSGLSQKLKRCDVHKVAPRVLQEGEKLLQERNELLERLDTIQSYVTCSLGQVGIPLNSEELDLRTELSNASWVRKERVANPVVEPANEPVSQPVARSVEEVVAEAIEVPTFKSSAQESVDISFEEPLECACEETLECVFEEPLECTFEVSPQ